MDFLASPNLLLEALAFLGRRAAGYDAAWMLARLRERGVDDLELLKARLAPITVLADRIGQDLRLDQTRLEYLFSNLPGFAHNTVGSYSRAFLLLHAAVPRYEGDLAAVMAQAGQRSRERIAGDLADILDLCEESREEPMMEVETFTERVLAMSVPAESKVAILELCHGSGALLAELEELLSRVILGLKRERALLQKCVEPFLQELSGQGPRQILARTSALDSRPDREERIAPFVFGMDTLIAMDQAPGRPMQVYCGVLRTMLQSALASAKEPRVEVYEAIRLLADQTRFEILCHLRNHDAYGQELAAKFGLSRNTIHHHMSKLLAAHLVKCTVDGNRVYYHADEGSIRRLLERQKELLLP